MNLPMPVRDSTIVVPYRRNAALAALPPRDLAQLAQHLRFDGLLAGAVLWDAGAPAKNVYFPLSGIISVTLPAGGRAVEVGSVGREAATVPAGGQSRHATRGVVLIAGTFASIPAPLFANLARENEEIARVAATCRDWLLAQAQQLAACNAVHGGNAVHPGDARVCRWLLLAADRIDGDAMPVTQRTIAQALGMCRSSLTVIALGLQAEGVIRCQRGRVEIRNRNRLAAACDCCAALAPANWPFAR